MSGTPLVVEGRTEYKDEQLLARLIGAAVLLAIAVIVLPFVLDGAGSQHEYEYAETLPVEPDRPVLERSYSSRQPLPPAPSDSIEEIVVTVPVVQEAAQAAASAALEKPDLTSAIEPVSAASDGAPVQNDAASVVEPQSTDIDARVRQIPSGWNIQIASFVKPENASKLLNRLDKENFTSFVNQINGKQRPIYRVFVGPLANQIDALELKNRIDRKYRVKSIMVKRN